MPGDIKDFFRKEPKAKDTVKEILTNPYIEKNQLLESVGISDQEAEKILGSLEGDEIILKLASQADSNVESRVPKTVYLINPDREDEVKGLI